MTWPLRLEDSPAFALGTYPQKAPKGTGFGHPVPGPDAPYAEESLVGYRCYDIKNVPVMYPFSRFTAVKGTGSCRSDDAADFSNNTRAFSAHGRKDYYAICDLYRSGSMDGAGSGPFRRRAG